MRVKICGITNYKDALCAIENGADALGFVFYKKSPRYIEPQKAKEIIQKLPPFVQMVGLFVNESAEFINKTCKDNLIDIAQLHFETNKELLSKLEVKFIEVIRVKQKADLLNTKSDRYYIVDAFVSSYGGEGKRINLEFFNGIDVGNFILAGGLNSSNLQEIKGLNFYGVDVSSGVEKSKGIKDCNKIKEFINLVPR
jgi:phosphoribosylanthranilate isomerase